MLSANSIREAAENAAAKLHVLYVRQRFFLALSIALLLCVLLFFRNGIASYLKMLFLPDSSRHFDWFALISTAVIAGALLVVCIIGLFSALGLHPDEWDVKACLDYGMTHFLPPDMWIRCCSDLQRPWLYPNWLHLYFYLAGKIALLFKTMFCSLAYYRVPNLLLFAALAFYFVRNIRREKLAHGRTGNLHVQSRTFFFIRRQMRWILPSLSQSPACCATRRVCFIAPWKRKNYAGEIFLLFFF